MVTTVLPFKQDDIYLGLAQISGLLRIEDDVLEIEYRVEDTTLGLLDSGVKKCHIPMEIIDSVDVKKGWFSGKFEIVFNRFPDLDNPLQLEENRLKLSVKKKELDKARAFRSALMHEILERKLDDPEEGERESGKHHNDGENRREATSQGKRFRTSSGPGKTEGGLTNMLRSE